MYLLKQVRVNNLEEKIVDVNGIEFTDFGTNGRLAATSLEYFLGIQTKLELSSCAEVEKTDKPCKNIVKYANSYELEKNEYGPADFVLKIWEKEEKIDGYIVFIEYLYDAKTDGEIIAGNLETMILLLREGNYLEFTLEEKGKKVIKMVDGKLFMSM